MFPHSSFSFFAPSADFDTIRQQYIAGHDGTGGGADWKLWKIAPKGPPTVNVTVSPSSVTESGSQVLTYTFTRSGSTSSALTVNFSVGVTASRSLAYTSTGFSGSSAQDLSC